MQFATRICFLLLVLGVTGAVGCGGSTLPRGTSQDTGGAISSGGAPIGGTSGAPSNTEGGSTATSNGGASSAGAAVCDPLASPAITLGTILGIAKDAQGTLYVSDQTPDFVTRVFVSTSGVLDRKYITGSGQRGNGSDSDYTLSFQDSANTQPNSQALLIQIRGGATTAMALGQSGSKSFIGDPNASYTPLSLVDSSVIAGMRLQNLPNTISYVEDVSNGNIIVITAPVDYTSVYRHKLYYGTADSVIERTITSDSQVLDISAGPTISFLVDSGTYTFSYYYPFPPDSGVRSGSISTSSGATMACTDRNSLSLDGLTFVCDVP